MAIIKNTLDKDLEETEVTTDYVISIPNDASCEVFIAACLKAAIFEGYLPFCVLKVLEELGEVKDEDELFEFMYNAY